MNPLFGSVAAARSLRGSAGLPATGAQGDAPLDRAVIFDVSVCGFQLTFEVDSHGQQQKVEEQGVIEGEAGQVEGQTHLIHEVQAVHHGKQVVEKAQSAGQKGGQGYQLPGGKALPNLVGGENLTPEGGPEPTAKGAQGAGAQQDQGSDGQHPDQGGEVHQVAQIGGHQLKT